MKLQHALREIDHITGQNLTIGRIESALTNRSYKLVAGKRDYSLRINTAASRSLGINRSTEKSILQLISKQHWSPSVAYISDKILLTHWYDGTTDFELEQALSRLISLLKEVHHIELTDQSELKVLNVAEHIMSYVSQCQLSSELELAIEKHCQQYRMPASLSLCYHDWHRGNLVISESKLTLLDWEYAAIGDPLIDIACFITGLKLNTTQIQMLTEELKLDSKTLQTAITLAELMSFTWHMVRFPDQDWFDKQKEWALRLTK